jgi:hypothetical protein
LCHPNNPVLGLKNRRKNGKNEPQALVGRFFRLINMASIKEIPNNTKRLCFSNC